ncbi:MAG: cld2 [Thermoleophilia bacterium]|nr:cld2 [Thermoleophilia bacterium]
MAPDDDQHEGFGDHPIRTPHGFVEEGADAARHFVSWTCYRLAPEWRRLPEADRERQKTELAEVLDAWSERIVLGTYTAVGIRPDIDLMTWRATPDLDLLQQCQTDIASTELGTYLETPYAYLATTKGSQYTKAAEQAGFRKPRPVSVTPTDKRYFIVYPFVKQRRWYALPAEERGRMMRDHAMIGRRYPGVTLNTAFSFGIDDQEFMTAFETDSVHDFLDLMMEMRASEASAYTERDTPIFTTIKLSARDALDTLGGVRASVLAER